MKCRFGILRSAVLAAAFSLTATTVAFAQQSPSPAAAPQLPPGVTPAMMKMMMTPGKAHPAGLPADVAPWMGCIPTMGFHYVNPKNAPFGPIYGYYNGKPVFTEVMIDKKAFDAGHSWDSELKPLPGYAIDHVDIWFEAHGHPGYEVPHYDIHAWYVAHAVHMKYCGNASGKKPAFL
jgi:hypothetical protein